jgi:hypothetical protein
VSVFGWIDEDKIRKEKTRGTFSTALAVIECFYQLKSFIILPLYEGEVCLENDFNA